jgi:hypothetical protein
MAMFAPTLRGRIQLHGRDKAGHGLDLRVGEGTRDAAQPQPIHARIIVGEGDDFVPGLGETAIARPIEAGSFLADIAVIRMVAKERFGVAGARGVIDDDQLELGII